MAAPTRPRRSGVASSSGIASQPAGLGLYWIATNVWSLGQQVIVQKLIPAPTPPAPGEVKKKKAPPPPPRKRKRRR